MLKNRAKRGIKPAAGEIRMEYVKCMLLMVLLLNCPRFVSARLRFVLVLLETTNLVNRSLFGRMLLEYCTW